MKKNKTFVTLALLIAVAVLAVGYAAIGNIEFIINGTASATASDDNFKVVFDNTVTPVVTKTRETATVTADFDNTDSEHKATLNVSGLTTTGDKATATYTIKNKSPELNATLAVDTIGNTNEDYFDVTAEFANPTVAANNGTTTITVTVELIKTPITDVNTTITVPFKASPVAAS